MKHLKSQMKIRNQSWFLIGCKWYMLIYIHEYIHK
jgi:hypothetical protein